MKLSQIESVEIYSKSSCPFCVRAKQLLDANNISYDEYLVGTHVSKEDIQSRVDAMGVNVEIKTVPQIFVSINGNWVYIGGFTELSKIPK